MMLPRTRWQLSWKGLQRWKKANAEQDIPIAQLQAQAQAVSTKISDIDTNENYENKSQYKDGKQNKDEGPQIMECAESSTKAKNKSWQDELAPIAGKFEIGDCDLEFNFIIASRPTQLQERCS